MSTATVDAVTPGRCPFYAFRVRGVSVSGGGL